MTELEIKKLADAADMIVDWYAFFKQENNIKIINLQNPHHILVLSNDGKLLETNMTNLEVITAQQYYDENKEFLFEDCECDL